MKYLFIYFLFVLLSINAFAQTIEQQSFPKGLALKVKNIPQIKKLNIQSIIFREDFKGKNNWKTIYGLKNTDSKTSLTKKSVINSNEKYTNNSDDWLISPSILLENIGPHSKILLEVHEWFEIENNYDKGYTKISTDNGNSWITIGANDGFSDWRIKTYDISRFSGKEIKIAFNLVTDDSVVMQGWKIDDLKIFKVSQTQSLNLSITNLNSQNFPFIYMNAVVDENGAGLDRLNQSNFKVYENNNLQTDLFSVTPPQSGGGVRLTDIIFVLDVTGSMEEEIESVRANMTDFVEALGKSDINYSIGFVVFSDITYVYNNYNLYSNAEDILNIINNIQLGEHGLGYGDDTPENQLQAMSDASLMNFRPGSQKVFIMLTDASAHEADGVTSLTVEALTEKLKQNKITVYPIFDISDPDQDNQYIPIAEATNSRSTYYNIYDNFNDIIYEIGNLISSSYVISYKSNNPNFDGTERLVKVEVNYNSESSIASASYIPGAAPVITRTNNTIDYHKQAWADGTSFNIEAEITGNISPGVQSAKLYYKNTSSSTYLSLEMFNTGGNTYSATISGSDVATPGIDYYITATDGISTSSSPSTNPSSNPYQIAILPNVAPSITHTPVTSLTAGNPISINSAVIDNTNSLVEVKLYYRKIGQLLYQEQLMTNTLGNNYAGTIPASFVTSDGVEYYIFAYDNFGVGNSSGTADYPHVIGGKVDLSNYLVLKEDLIKEFNDLGFYNNAEAKAMQIVDKIKNKYNLGSATNAELENIARLYLAEHMSREALFDADQLADISTRGLSGTIDILFYVVGKTGGFVKTVKKIPYVGRYLAWPMEKAHEGLVKMTGDVIKMFSLHVLQTSPKFYDLGWRYGNIAISQGAKKGLDEFYERGMDKLAKLGTEKGIFDKIHDWTKEEIFLNFYQGNTEDKVDKGVNFSLQNPFIFNEYNFSNSQQQFNAKLTEMKKMDNNFIDWGNIVLGESEAISDAAFFGSMVILIIAIIATIATGGTALPAAVVAFLNILPTLNLILGSAKLLDTATMVGWTNVALPQYIEQGINIAYDQNPSNLIQSNIISKNDSHDLKQQALPTFKIINKSKNESSASNFISELKKLRVQLNDPQTKITDIDIDKLELYDNQLNQSVKINSAQIFESFADANIKISNYDSLYFQPFYDAKLASNLKYSSFYLSLAASFVDFENMEYRASSINYLDSLLSSISVESNEISTINSLLENNNVEIPPLVEIINVDIPQFIEKGTQFSIKVKIKNISPINVGGGKLSLVLLNDVTKKYSQNTTFNKLNYDEEKEFLWHIISESTDSLVSCYLELLPDSNNITFTSSGRYYFNFPVDLKNSPRTQGKLDNSNIYFYPNPFNPNSEEGLLRYSLAKNADVTIKIYDISNNLIRKIEETGVPANTEMSATWDGKDQSGKVVSNGIYFYVIESSSGERAIGKIAVLK